MNGSSGALVLLFGNSHANCMANALRRKLIPAVEDGVGIRIVSTGSDAFPGGLTVTDSTGKRIANPVLARSIQQALSEERGRTVWLASVIGGNQANRMGLFNVDDGPVVFIDPDDSLSERPSAYSGSSRFLPYDLIEYQFARSMESMAEMYRLLPLDRVAGLVHLEGPPPAPDPQFITSHLPERTRALFEARGLSRLSPDDVAPIALRHRLWRVQCRVAKRIADVCGAQYLPPPEEAFGPDGFRRPELCADATHATAEYGAMYLRALRRFVLQRGMPKNV